MNGIEPNALWMDFLGAALCCAVTIITCAMAIRIQYIHIFESSRPMQTFHTHTGQRERDTSEKKKTLVKCAFRAPPTQPKLLF